MKSPLHVIPSLLIALILPVTSYAASAQEAGVQLSPTDQAFVKKAAQDSKAEVELGKLAVKQAQNPEVKKFGQQMSKDHSKANEKLAVIAKKKGMTVPADLSNEHKELKKTLSGLKGEEFDKKYISAMLEEHNKDVNEFEKQAKQGQDAELKSFAEQTLPNLKHHLQMAQSLMDESGNSRGTQ